MSVEVFVNTAKTLKSRLNATVTEKDVEHEYKSEFRKYLPKATLTSEYQTDGVLVAETLYVLLEFKYDLDFTKRSDVLKPLMQGLVYLKKFYDNEESVPTALFVGDRNECFLVPTKVLEPLLKRTDIDWSVAPSDAWRALPSLYRELMPSDHAIQPYVLDVDDRVDFFSNIIKRLEGYHAGEVIRVPVTVHNISGVYRSWCDRVLNEKDVDPTSAVHAFLSSIRGDADVIESRSELVTASSRLRINVQPHKAFFSWFDKTFDLSNQKSLTAIQDRLLDEETRRRSGDFYTPTVWVDEAHKMLDEHLGENWRDEYVVWDCAAGSGNLTRDYSFKELYLSTLHDGDARTIQDMGYNTGSEVFQFDFLNDPIHGDGIGGEFTATSRTVPAKLMEALKAGKKFVFLINPPFGTAKTSASDKGDKAGIAISAVNYVMNLGHAKQQLYAQFMYRISEMVKRFGLKDSVFALYSKPLFMSGSSFKKFREYFYSNWAFQNRFLFRADEFNGTSNQWGCSFTLWQEGSDSRNSFDLIVKKRNELGIIEDLESKAFYAPENTASDWVKAPKELWHGKGEDVPQLSSAVQVKQKGVCRIPSNSLGYFHSNGNNLQHSGQLVGLYSGAFSAAHGVHIFPCNYLRTVALFAARRTVSGNWINDSDEYCEPDTTLEGYEQWNHDAIIYSLFETKSQQSSLRRITYKDELWDIQNEFFWMSNEEMRTLADKHGFKEMYNDAIKFNSDRYVYNVLQGMTLSDDAQWLLDEARRLTKLSMEMRLTAYHEQPELHLDAWDAGWLQIRRGCIEPFYPDEYKIFTTKFLEFRDRLKEGVYKYGFLK